MKKVFFVVVLSLLVLFTANAMAKTEIIVAISAAPGSTQYITAEEFTRRANDLLGDKATRIEADGAIEHFERLGKVVVLGRNHGEQEVGVGEIGLRCKNLQTQLMGTTKIACVERLHRLAVIRAEPGIRGDVWHRRE